MQLRDYQEYAVDSIFKYFASGKDGNPILGMPTGTGKSLVIAEFVLRVINKYPGQRIIMLTHVKELIEQNYEKLLTLFPMAPAGIYSAGVGKKESNFPITFAGIQSICKHPELFGHVDLLIIDECHLVPEAKNSNYRKFINDMTTYNPKLKVIGLTATKWRMGLGLLTEGSIFTDMCCDMTDLKSFNWFIDQGYLAPLIPMGTSVEIDVSSVRKQGGEFVQRDLQAASDQEYITREAVAEMAQVGHDREHWLIFGTGVEHVNHIVSELLAQGITAVPVHSKMTSKERDENIAAFKAGKVRALVNMGVLTTGFDAPFIDLLGILRATESPGLWVQILGRGTRPFYEPGFDLSTKHGRLQAIGASSKPNCLVLDFAGNTKRLGPINDPVLPKRKGKGGGDAPVRLCNGLWKLDEEGNPIELIQKCGVYIHASLQVCPHCGAEYPPETKFGAEASQDELIAKEKKKKEPPPVVVFKVTQVEFRTKISRKGESYLEIIYKCALRRFTFPLCIQHNSSYARHKARQWWRKATGEDMVPDTIDEAIYRFKECRTPRKIKVQLNPKYPDILCIDYDGELDEE